VIGVELKLKKIYMYFYDKRKYQGELVSKDDNFLCIIDIVEGKIFLPIHNTVIKEVRG